MYVRFVGCIAAMCFGASMAFAQSPLAVGDSVATADLHARNIYWFNALNAKALYFTKYKPSFVTANAKANHLRDTALLTVMDWRLAAPNQAAVKAAAEPCEKLRDDFAKRDCVDTAFEKVEALGRDFAAAKYLYVPMNLLYVDYDSTKQELRALRNGLWTPGTNTCDGYNKCETVGNFQLPNDSRTYDLLACVRARDVDVLGRAAFKMAESEARIASSASGQGLSGSAKYGVFEITKIAAHDFDKAPRCANFAGVSKNPIMMVTDVQLRELVLVAKDKVTATSTAWRTEPKQ